MDLITKYEKLGVKYNNLFTKAVEVAKVEDFPTIAILFRTKKYKDYVTRFLRANYYRVVSNSIIKEWEEVIKKEKEKTNEIR